MQWHQLDHMQTISTSLQTDNHNNTPSLNFYRPDALPDAQPTVRALAALLFCIIVYWQFTVESCCRRTFITGQHFVELWAKV